MEDKYNPLEILRHVWDKFFGLSGHQNSSVEDYSVFIEIKKSKNECYQINVIKDILFRGTCSGTSWRVIQDHKELLNNKDLLGSVHIKFRNKPIKIDGKILKPFEVYDSFWDYISR